MGTTSLGIVYPDPSAVPKRQDLQDLAESVDDALASIRGAWTPYTPTWGANPTAPTLGNGTLVGYYMLIGKTVHFTIVLTIGSTTTLGSGTYTWTLPFTANLHGAGRPNVGYGSVNAGAVRPRHTYLPSSGTVALLDESGAVVDGSTPYALAAGNTIQITGMYEAA